jgi:predicted nucleotidyltransferase
MRTRNTHTPTPPPTAQGILDQILQNQISLRVLRYLARAGGDHTGRALAKVANASPSATLRALRDLVQLEVVERRTVGRAMLYKLNADHWLVDTGLGLLFEAEGAFFREIGRAIRAWVRTPLKAAIVYGSLARGTADPNSDVDLLCVTASDDTRDHAEHELDAMATKFRRRFARPVSYFVWSQQTLRKRYDAHDPLARNMVNTGHIVLGERMVELLR